jgi:hypothetical protein
MTKTKPSLGDWFCLSEGRESFTISPERDRQHLFGDRQWAEDIRRHLERSLVLKEPVRLVWVGQYGIGKTHRLFHTVHIVETEEMAFLPVYVVCSDIGEKSGFGRLHYQLVNQLGFERVRGWTHRYLRRIEDREDVLPPERLCHSADVATAIRSLGSGTDNLAQDAWSYLAGQRLEKTAAQYAKLTKPELDTSVEYSSVLGALSSIIEKETGKEILYLVDQMEAVTKITKRDINERWVETLRAILDLSNVGLIAAVGAEGEDLDYLPTIFLEPELIRRFGMENYQVMRHFEPDRTQTFVHDLLTVWIDRGKQAALEERERWSDRDDYSRDAYPFTAPAFERFCRYLSNDAERAKPSEIIMRFNRVTAEAFLGDHRLIDEGVLDLLDIQA